MGLFLLSLLCHPAWAHRPHVPVVALAVGPDAETAWLVLESNDASQIMSSTDGGRHWDARWSPAKAGRFVDGDWSEGPVLLSESGALWWADPAGQQWSVVELGELSAAVAVGSQLAVATEAGAWVADPANPEAGEWLWTARPLVRLAWEGERLWAVDAVGRVLRAEGGQLVPVQPSPSAQYIAFAEEVFLGTARSLRVLRDGAWEACAPLPIRSTEDRADEIGFLKASQDQQLLAGTGQELFRSADRCASWELVELDREPVSYGQVGDARSASDVHTGAWMVGDRAILSGWDGLWSGPIQDLEPSVLLPEAFARGVAFHPEFPQVPELWVGGYGGGPRVTTDGGLSWKGAGYGLAGMFTYDLVVLAQPPGVFYSGNHVLHRQGSTLGSWTALDALEMERVNYVQALGNQLVALGGANEEHGEGDLRVSHTLGGVWTEWPGLADAEGHPARVDRSRFLGRDTLLLATGVPARLLASRDGGDSFEEWAAGAVEERSAGAVLWPPDVSLRAVWATASRGVWISEDAGDSWRSPDIPPAGQPHLLRQADDASLWLADRTGQIWMSEDGALSWETVGPPIAPLIYDLVPAPAFADSGLMMVATHAGTLWSDAEDRSWRELPRQERLEDDSIFLSCRAAGGGDCARWESRQAGNWGGYLLFPGAQLSFTFRGDSFHLIGESLEGEIEVWVDGEELGRVPMSRRNLRTGSGWHDVRIEVLSAPAEGARVDRVTTHEEHPPFLLPVPTSDGCAGSRALLWLVGLSWGAARRRDLEVDPEDL